MRLSHYFEDLSSAYNAELEDLQTDSEGKNVLSQRLKEKRSQFAALMQMIEFSPEMVAPAFHGGIKFVNPHAMSLLSAAEPEEFPEWNRLADAVQFEPWAAELVDIALSETGGEQFMATVVCLEFLQQRDSAKSSSRIALAPSADEHESDEEKQERDENGRDSDSDLDDDERDLDEAGAGWMEEQGFDKRE